MNQRTFIGGLLGSLAAMFIPRRLRVHSPDLAAIYRGHLDDIAFESLVVRKVEPGIICAESRYQQLNDRDAIATTSWRHDLGNGNYQLIARCDHYRDGKLVKSYPADVPACHSHAPA